MRILSLTQPWASLIALGHKRIETRSWGTTYRGPLAIHATLTLPKSWREFRDPAFVEALRPVLGLNEMGVPNLDRLPLGAIVAVCELAGMEDTRHASVRLRQTAMHGAPPGCDDDRRALREFRFGDYSPGRCAWMLRDVRALDPPVPYKGGQGLRRLPDEVEALLIRASGVIDVIDAPFGG